MNTPPYVIQTGKPLVRCRLVSNPPPNALLRVQPGLVPRKISESYARMAPQKLLHRLSTMPPRTIHVQPNPIAFQMPIEMTQYLQKALSVPASGFDHTPTLKQRSYPARHVEAIMMLAGCWNSYPFPTQSPATSGTRMQGEAALILKSHCFMPAQVKEFFLTVAETLLPPTLLLAGNCNQLASCGSQAGASISALAVPSTPHQSDASRVAPRLAHPTGFGTSRTPAATVPNAAPVPARFAALISSVAPGALSP